MEGDPRGVDGSQGTGTVASEGSGRDEVREQVGSGGAGLCGQGQGLGCNSQSSRKLQGAFEHGSHAI